MNLYLQAAEQRLESALNSALPDAVNTIGIVFHLSSLKIRRDNKDHITIAANILRDLMKTSLGEIYVFNDGDIILINKNGNSREVQESIYQMRYLFADDPLTFINDGADNDNFCRVYDTTKNWNEFLKFCTNKIGAVSNKKDSNNDNSKPPLLSIINSQIEEALYDLDWEQIIYKKHICTNPKMGKMSSILDYIVYNPILLKKALATSSDIVSNPHLYSYIEEFIQIRIMIKLIQYISENPRKAYIWDVSLNTLKSEEFKIFDQALNYTQKRNLILNIKISDVFKELSDFYEKKEQLISSGYKLCLHGLDNISFLQADRNLLGFDLMMLSWESSIKKQSYESLFFELKNKIKVCGSSRVIMSNCDTNKALSMATSLGINLVEGHLIEQLKDEA